MYELAGKAEICAYYDNIMHDFVSSGRVQYLPMCEYQDDTTIKSLVSDATYNLQADKIVDATFMNVKVPAMVAPCYDVAEGLQCVAPKFLAGLSGQCDHFVIVGVGKTSLIVACFY